MDEKVSVEITKGEGVAVVRFNSSSISDVEEVATVSNQIRKFVDQDQPSRLIFDFEGVKFFSSQVLGLLLDIRAKLQAVSGKVVISAINPQLHRVFKITNLDKIFEFFPDRDSAVRAMSMG
jgi:anti-sigma B factor antagonist